MEAAEADDMVEETEFDESFLSMTPRAAQPSVVVADRGVPWGVGDVGDVGDADVLRPKPIVYSGAGAGARELEFIVAESLDCFSKSQLRYRLLLVGKTLSRCRLRVLIVLSVCRL